MASSLLRERIKIKHDKNKHDRVETRKGVRGTRLAQGYNWPGKKHLEEARFWGI